MPDSREQEEQDIIPDPPETPPPSRCTSQRAAQLATQRRDERLTGMDVVLGGDRAGALGLLSGTWERG